MIDKPSKNDLFCSILVLFYFKDYIGINDVTFPQSGCACVEGLLVFCSWFEEQEAGEGLVGNTIILLHDTPGIRKRVWVCVIGQNGMAQVYLCCGNVNVPSISWLQYAQFFNTFGQVMFEPMVSIQSDSRQPLVCGCLGNGMVAFQYCNFLVPNGLLHGGWRGQLVWQLVWQLTFMVLQPSSTL